MGKGKSQHVVPTDRGWAVKTGGESKARKTFATQADAIKAGRTIARKDGSELVIHGRDGRIREKNSYGNDPFPPRDKR